MKKTLFSFIILAIVLTIGMTAFTGSAVAEEKAKSLFSIYLGEKTTENFLKAFEHYEAERADTVNHRATVILSYLHMKELERNLALLEENLGDLTNKNLFSTANLFLGLEKFDRAIAIYKVLNEKSPKWSCPWRHRGEAHWKNKEYDDAVMSLEMAIETRETHYDAYTQLSEVLFDMKEYEKSLATLELGLTYYGKDIEDPDEEVDNVAIHFLYYDLLKRAGRDEDAAKILIVLKKIAEGDERLKELE